MLLDTRAEPSEVEDLVGAQDLTGCLSAGSSTRSSPLGRAESRRLVADAGFEQPRPVLGDDVGVRLDEPAHDDLAETERRLDHDAHPSPLAGSAENITPERSESTMRCTTTAIAYYR